MITLQNILKRRNDIVHITKKLGFHQLGIFNEPRNTQLNLLAEVNSKHPEASHLNNSLLAAYLSELLGCEVTVTVTSHLSPAIKDNILQQSRLLTENEVVIKALFNGKNKVFFETNTEDMTDTEIAIAEENHTTYLNMAKTAIADYEKQTEQRELNKIKQQLSTGYSKWDDSTKQEFIGWFNHFLQSGEQPSTILSIPYQERQYTLTGKT